MMLVVGRAVELGSLSLSRRDETLSCHHILSTLHISSLEVNGASENGLFPSLLCKLFSLLPTNVCCRELSVNTSSPIEKNSCCN